MESVDDLFGADIIDEIDKKTPSTDEPMLDAYGNPLVGEEDDEIVMLDDDALANLFDGSVPFDADEDGNLGLSGIGNAEDDDEGVPVPEAATGKKNKKDKRTARSQAHAKKKTISEEPVMESGIFAEDEEFEDTSGNSDGLAGTQDFEEGNEIDFGEEIVSLTPASRKSKKGKTQDKKRKGAAIAYDDEATDLESDGYDGLPDEEGDWEYEDEYEQVDLPDWADSIRRKVNANVAHAFLLNGNVRDYMVRNISIKDGIVAVLDGAYENFDIIAEYDQAHGIYFYGEDIEIRNGRTLADAYKERFIEEMHEAQERLSIARTDEIPNRDPVVLFTIISDMFDRPSKTRTAKILLFIDYSDLLVPDASSAQMKPDERKLAITLADIGRSQAADDAGNVLIFITDDMTQLSTRIRSAESRIEQIKIPIPDRAERADFIDNVLDVSENVLSDGTQVFEHEESISKEAFAINSAGLSRIQIEDIMLRALSEDEPLSMQLMKERKQEIIKEDYDDVLEIIDPKTGFERVGGMEHMKEFFREEIIEPVHAGEKESVAMGVMLAGPPGTAKALSIHQLIPTLKGMIPAGNIKPGDMVFGTDGKPYPVMGVSPQGFRDAYALSLGDNREIICSDDHLWSVLEESHGEMKERLYTTKYMFEKGVIKHKNCSRKKNGEFKNHARFYMLQCAPVEYPEKDFFLDPYIVGAMLGDGSCTEPTLSISCDPIDRFIPDEVARLLGATAQHCLSQNGHKVADWRFVASETDLDAMRNFFQDEQKYTRKLWRSAYAFKDIPQIMTTSYHKRIPEEYKYGSIEQRYALIQGLMDTDGTAGSAPSFVPEFGSVSKELCEDVAEVLNSLGYSAYAAEAKGYDYDAPREIKGYPVQSSHKFYKVHMQIPNNERYKLFRLPRKVAAAASVKGKKQRRRYERKSITSIEKLPFQEEMVCFIVGSPDHLFLAGNYVPTHNTFLSKAVAKEAGMNFVALNLNRIMEKWVGSTERNLDRALDCALAMAPTIIFIDEIDEALPNRADPNASSVNKRINQRLLTFFSDTSHRGEVIILAATNYPEKIDPAFKRAGRFDVRVPIFAPDEFDRMRIMRVIAKGRGYTFSWFEDPDKLVDNPFKNLKDWLHAGNVPVSDDRHFTGDREMYSYTIKDNLGNDERHDVYIPVRTIRIIDKDKITLQEFYENVRILMPDLPQRQPDASTGEIDTDEVFQRNIKDYIRERTDILGYDEKNMEEVFVRVWKWEQIYSTFVDQTFRMTGAEMDVIMNKAINLYKKWKRRLGPERVQDAIKARIMKDDHDIPWYPFLMDACKKTVNAVAGIKQMEDMALINTSDTDFIPDAMYAQLDDGRVISYRERHEELTARQEKSTLG